MIYYRGTYCSSKKEAFLDVGGFDEEMRAVEDCDFYDASVCAEYRRRGLKVVVPKQETPWVIHDDGMMNLYSYGKYRKLFIENYLSD